MIKTCTFNPLLSLREVLILFIKTLFTYFQSSSEFKGEENKRKELLSIAFQSSSEFKKNLEEEAKNKT